MNEEETALIPQLRQEILHARKRVYHVSGSTPLERVNDNSLPFQLFLKREDLSPINAYKWRGAYNRMALLSQGEKDAGVVTASAGNHAQGVALAARLLGTSARIFMPRSTPQVKQDAVCRHGGSHIEIILAGDAYDMAYETALSEAAKSQKAYIHAYDDLQVMGGQGTIADEIVMSGQGPFDYAFLQIGGGGMAAAVACWLKTYYPEMTIIGVEGDKQASMQAAVNAGSRVRLDELDIFCDGTAVRQAGELTYPICRDLIDEFITVSNESVSESIQYLWNQHRCIPEPAGAMGVAGALQYQEHLKGKKVVSILCGANIDFNQLGTIAANTGIGVERRFFLRIEIPEAPGSMLRLLDDCLKDYAIIEFQYGKSHPDKAWPIFGISASSEEIDALAAKLQAHQFPFEEVGSHEDVQFRVIPYKPECIQHPLFLKLEFYERTGALHDFLNQQTRGQANFFYFNYAYSGERVGHALIGLEFDSQEHRTTFLKKLPANGVGYRACTEISSNVMQRLI